MDTSIWHHYNGEVAYHTVYYPPDFPGDSIAGCDQHVGFWTNFDGPRRPHGGI